MKVYLSGPISENPDAFELFSDGEVEVLVWADEVINPMLLGVQDEWSVVMKEAITLLMGADAIYMLRGWGASKGAILERCLAQKLDMPVFYQEKGKEQYESNKI